MKQILVENCVQCPYKKIKTLSKPTEPSYHVVAYCTHHAFCEDEGSHLSCENMLIDVSERLGQAFEKLFNLPDWCPLDNIEEVG